MLHVQSLHITVEDIGSSAGFECLSSVEYGRIGSIDEGQCCSGSIQKEALRHGF